MSLCFLPNLYNHKVSFYLNKKKPPFVPSLIRNEDTIQFAFYIKPHRQTLWLC